MATKKRLIDANELIAILEKIADEDESEYFHLDEVTQEIFDAPTVDAAPVVHGRWEPRKDVPGFVRCSVCHDCNIYDDWPDGKKWNYCPNCGADMRERKDND